jgi:hypothetical protein
VCTIPPGLAYCDGVSDVRLVIHHIMFCVKVLVIQVLSCSCVRLAVHHRVARWIHLFGVRFVYIDELLAGLMFPRLQVTCIAHVIGRSIRSIGWEGASWKIGPNNPSHLGIRFQRLLGEHPQIHPHRFVFLVLSRKSHTKKFRVLSFCHSLDCIEIFVLVAGHFLPLHSNPFSSNLSRRRSLCCVFFSSPLGFRRSLL